MSTPAPDPLPRQRPAAMTDLLLDLAGEAQRWQHALLEAHGELAVVPDPTDRSRVVTGAHAVEVALTDLLRQARAASLWLCSARATPQSGPTLLALAAWRPQLRVRVLLGANAAPAGVAALAGRPQAAEVRVSNAGTFAGRPRHDTLLVDGSVLAVLPYHEGTEPQTLVVTQTVIADVTQSLFDTVWSMATPVEQLASIHTVLGSDVKREIVRRLAAGDKDESIARGLNISLRTCRRYIAEIFSATGAASRFQAGFRLALEARTGRTDGRAQ